MAAQEGAIVAVGEVQSSEPERPKVIQTHTQEVGVIVPRRPDVKNIIDKTAEFVGKQGLDFEKKILADPSKAEKFSFLQPTDLHHKYYRFRILEVQQGTEAAKAAFNKADGVLANLAAAPVVVAPAAANVPPPTQELVKPADAAYTVPVPTGLHALDLDVIRLTAQFVARNGKQFMQGLLGREQASTQFHFLKPTHSLFTFFTQLTDAYQRVLLPAKDMRSHLERDVADQDTILGRALRRLEWTRARESEADEAAAERERERVAMMEIDWHSFSIVRTVAFDDDEDESSFNRPLTLKDVIQMNAAGVLQEEEEEAAAAGGEGGSAAPGGANEVTMDDEEAELVAQAHDEGPAPPPVAPPASPPPAEPVAPESAAGQVVVEDEDAPIRVVKDYVRSTPAGQAYDPTQHVVSPITGELVPLAEMQEHMRVNLLDPRWKVQREAMLAKIKETTTAGDPEIMSNLHRLARTRPDVFGTGTDAVAAAVQADLAQAGPALARRPDPKAPPRLQLGPAPAPGSTPAGPSLAPLPRPPPPMSAPPPAMPPPPLPAPPGGPKKPATQEGPAAKRARTDGSAPPAADS